MKKIASIILVGLLALASAMLFSCTSNEMAKQYGGSTTINLPAGHKLVTATWKNSDLWYLTRPMRAGETAETSSFHEDSNYGIWEGTVNFVESNVTATTEVVSDLKEGEFKVVTPH